MAKQLLKTNGKIRNHSFPIVAIGASAGGLEAVRDLLENLSPTTGMAYVYIQHLDPTHKSMLSEILSRSTKMNVVEAKHLLPIEKDHVYIIPPNKDLAIIDGVLTLNPRPPKPSIHLPVDKFFSSLAERQKEAAVGIVLSGNASDGTFGLKSIKLAGGLTIAQDETARFQSMPRSAIAEGVVDMILSPKEIAKELERMSEHPALRLEPEYDEHETKIEDAEREFQNIIQLLKKATGVDFSHYKISTIRRRVLRRMLIYKLETLEEYYNYVKQHTNEVNTLYQDLLIHVTTFFRDEELMQHLKNEILPKILERKSSNEALRIWIPACATGEEAYSVAMLLVELFDEKQLTRPIQIFATDLSDLAISKARLGLFSVNDLENISQERIDRFFDKVDGSYRVKKQLRDLCVFAHQNVFKDPPFSRIDLISCCNLMIYLDSVLQKKILSIFHYALMNSGYLVLGKSETVNAAPELFLQVEKKYKLFTKKKEKTTNVVFDMNYRLTAPGQSQAAISVSKISEKDAARVVNVEKAINDILLRQFVKPSVLVNRHMDILQFWGSTGLFLEAPHGKASHNLLKMARTGLTFELRNAIHKVSKSNEKTKKSDLEIHIDGNKHLVSIEVLPVPAEDDEQLFLVVFEALPEVQAFPENTAQMQDLMVAKLQDELNVAKEDMRSMIEEQEANLEELQSANEEIVSSNEELQSINEELETSKEEVESSNEELLTINNELQVRNTQLTESYEYAEVVFQAIQEAVVVMDREFRVKKANSLFYELFKVSEEETEGVLLFELGNRQWNILKLRELLEETMNGSSTLTQFEMKHIFPNIGEKVMVLKARRVLQNTLKHQLIILSMVDITEHRQAEKIVREREIWFRNTANSVPVMIWATDAQHNFNFFNETWLSFTGRTLDQEIGRGWMVGIHRDEYNLFVEIFASHTKERSVFEFEFRLQRLDGQYRWVQLKGSPSFSPEGVFIGFVGSCAEIHDKKLLFEELETMVRDRTRELRDAVRDLEVTNAELNQYAFVASHDLQEPLRKIITFSDRLMDKEKEMSEDERMYLDKIINCAQRMRRLINDLLNFSKTGIAGKEFVTTDLNLIAIDVLKDQDVLIEETNAKITVEKLPVIEAIPLQMYQLFYNLVNNSLKFSRSDAPQEIIIRSELLSPEEVANYPGLLPQREYVKLELSDKGMGFKQEFAEKIFSIFQRLNIENKYAGAGIGLALCRKVVVNHKGIIFARSEVGVGTTFYMIIPVTQK